MCSAAGHESLIQQIGDVMVNITAASVCTRQQGDRHHMKETADLPLLDNLSYGRHVGARAQALSIRTYPFVDLHNRGI